MLNESDKGLEFELFFNIIHNVYGKIAKTIIERSVLRNKFVRTRNVSDKETYESEVTHCSFFLD